jgi:hypothetical protein
LCKQIAAQRGHWQERAKDVFEFHQFSGSVWLNGGKLKIKSHSQPRFKTLYLFLNAVLMNGQDVQEITLNDLVLKLYEWYSYLKSRWVLLVLAGVIGVTLGYTYAFLKKPRYEAVATFALEDSGSSGNMGQYAGLASMIGLDLGGGGGGIFQGDNIIELYKSRAMIQQTLLSEADFAGKKQLLVERYMAFNGLEKDAEGKPHPQFRLQANQRFSRIQDSLLGEVVNRISTENLMVAKPDKKSSVIRVQFTSKDELFAKTFTDYIIQNVSDYYVTSKTKKSSRNVAVLQRQTDSVRRMLNGNISAIATSVDANPNPNLARQVLRVPSQRRQIDAEANKAILVELVKNLELSKIALLKETPLIQVVDVPILPLKKVAPGKFSCMFIGGFVLVMLSAVALLLRRGLKSIIG